MREGEGISDEVAGCLPWSELPVDSTLWPLSVSPSILPFGLGLVQQTFPRSARSFTGGRVSWKAAEGGECVALCEAFGVICEHLYVASGRDKATPDWIYDLRSGIPSSLQWTRHGNLDHSSSIHSCAV